MSAALGGTPAFHTIKNAAEILGVTRWDVSCLIAEGGLDSTFIGVRRVIPAASLDRYVASLLAEANA